MQLPAFMPVGTQGTVKGLTDRSWCGAPGPRWSWATPIIWHCGRAPRSSRELGGLHRFMGWDGPILTDSGGFQVFSLERLNRVTDQSVVFRSHVDGQLVDAHPPNVPLRSRSSWAVTWRWSWITSSRCRPTAGGRRGLPSDRWLGPSDATMLRPGDDQTLFAIVQGGLDATVATVVCEQLVAHRLSRLCHWRVECWRNT